MARVTDAGLDEMREWQNRPLDPVYPVVFFDALRVKIHGEGLDATCAFGVVSHCNQSKGVLCARAAYSHFA
jgi:transposase-like protein